MVSHVLIALLLLCCASPAWADEEWETTPIPQATPYPRDDIDRWAVRDVTISRGREEETAGPYIGPYFLVTLVALRADGLCARYTADHCVTLVGGSMTGDKSGLSAVNAFLPPDMATDPNTGDDYLQSFSLSNAIFWFNFVNAGEFILDPNNLSLSCYILSQFADFGILLPGQCVGTGGLNTPTPVPTNTSTPTVTPTITPTNTSTVTPTDTP